MNQPMEEVGKSSAFGRLLGLQIVKAEAGEAVIRLNMHDGLRNLHGKLHGGALFSLIDSAMGQASHSLSDGEPSSVTLECKVNYIRGVTEGELSCRAWVVHAGRRTQVIEAEVHQHDKLVAKAQATFACL
ncbi:MULTISPECIES: PaaI family thioesterase [Pseudomonas]|uniref:Acyl-CoA thioesterase n=2 Tax=Pseudomonadales TaxID=72274 RepID=A0A7Z0BQV6_9GAMM|nr:MULTISPECIES: PaaI family thioesterase [Pseudomonas]MCW2294549.1 acyl-CoA thioesterase [Pseudomonas sp. BIGb0408]NYH76177.1 acyl-CoA thioesterase [Pseudomonas flavescens]